MDDLFTCYIYNIVNKVNGKVYVGQTKNTKKRATSHKYMLNKGIHHSKYLQNSFNKYGIENFEFSIIEECTNSDVDDREIFYIQKFKSNNPDYGYNVLAGGNSRRDIFENSLISDEGKKAISERMSSYWEEITSNPEFGRKVIRINDLKIFQYAKKAGDETETDYYRILENCRKKIDYASVDEFGLPVVWMFYSEWNKEMTYKKFIASNDTSKFKYHNRRVICVNDGIIYENAKHASEEYDIELKDILNSCKRVKKVLKKESKNLLFLYSDEYYRNKLLEIPFINFFIDKKSVVNITTNTVYSSFTEASLLTGVNKIGISRCCNGELKTSGIICGQKQIWRKVDNYEGDIRDLKFALKLDGVDYF